MNYTISLDQYSITIETNKHVNGGRLKNDQLNRTLIITDMSYTMSLDSILIYDGQ